MSTRAGSLLLAAVVLVGLLALPAAAADGARASETISRINNARAAQGLPPLEAFGDRSEVRRANDQYASTQTAHGRASSGWYFERGANRFGETQAHGTSVSPKGVVDLWRNSGSHAAIMFDAEHTHVTVSVTSAGGRDYYTAQFVTIPGSRSSGGSSGGSDDGSGGNGGSGGSSGSSDAGSSETSPSASDGGSEPAAAEPAPEPAAEPQPAPEPEPEPEAPAIDAAAVLAEVELAVLEDRHGPVALAELVDVVVDSESEVLPAAWPGDPIDRGVDPPADTGPAPMRPDLLDLAADAMPVRAHYVGALDEGRSGTGSSWLLLPLIGAGLALVAAGTRQGRLRDRVV